MKFLFGIILSVVVTSLDSVPGVEIVQDSTVSVMLDEAMHGKKEWVEIDGYRVQIYSSNKQQKAKTEALDLETRLKGKISRRSMSNTSLRSGKCVWVISVPTTRRRNIRNCLYSSIRP